MAEVRDPRDRITPTAFGIAPHLIGVSLASPWRRALAAGVDVVLALMVVELGGPGLISIVSAVLFVLAAMKSPSKTRIRRFGRGVLVAIGAILVFALLYDWIDDAQREARWVAQTEARAERRADPEPEPVDSLAATEAVRAYAVAFAAGDSLAVDSLREAVVPVVAGEEVARLERVRREARSLDRENDALRDQIENPGFLRSVWALAADVGLAIGWLGVYAVLTLVLWNGYTPGKRLVGIRVVRLDGGRIWLMTALDRLGGYAAGLVTGLIGFAQVLWDPNRQGVQDKIAGTVVVRHGRHGPVRAAGSDSSGDAGRRPVPAVA